METKKRKINLSLDSKFCERIEKMLERLPWLGIESIEDFVVMATVRRYEDLLLLEASQLKR